jgi:hypothetical protein
MLAEGWAVAAGTQYRLSPGAAIPAPTPPPAAGAPPPRAPPGVRPLFSRAPPPPPAGTQRLTAIGDAGSPRKALIQKEMGNFRDKHHELTPKSRRKYGRLALR